MISPAVFRIEQARALLAQAFAPWVCDLGVTVESVGRAGAVLRMPHSPRILRPGDIVCGQSLMALADTAMVFAVCGALGHFRPMATATQTTHFMRPIAGADVLAEARVLRHGRAMAFGEVMMRAADKPEPAIQVAISYAFLDEGR